MSRKAAVLTIFFGLSVTLCGCSTRPKGLKNAEGVARAASENVGEVSKAAKGENGAPIIILEENHVSRAGQIQHAITLVRLHDRYGLRDIALEGYLKEHPEIKTDWFNDAASGQDPEAKERRNQVAVRLLKEGEIGSAEFLKLVYADVRLHPIENKSQYLVERDENAARAPTLYLVRIAQESLQGEQSAKTQQLNKESAALQGEEKQKKVNEILDYIISSNPWTQAKAKLLRDPNASKDMSAEQLLAIEGEIKSRAEELSIPFAPNEKDAMERSLKFWRSRVAASETMVRSTGDIADQKEVSIIAMIVGAAHTEGIISRLIAARRPFAVVTPLSLKNGEKNGDLTENMLERRYKRLSVYSEGFMGILLQAFPPPSDKRPEPALLEPALQAKTELYLKIDEIVQAILGPPKPSSAPGGAPPTSGGKPPSGGGPPFSGKPPSGGGPPFADDPPWGFPEDHFDGKWIYIDPRKIVRIPDTEDGKGQALLFPVTLKTMGSESPKVIYVKATRGNAEVSSRERADVEAMLQTALQEVQSEKEPGKTVEDKTGRVQISLDTVAAIASTQEGVKKVKVGS